MTDERPSKYWNGILFSPAAQEVAKLILGDPFQIQEESWMPPEVMPLLLRANILMKAHRVRFNPLEGDESKAQVRLFFKSMPDDEKRELSEIVSTLRAMKPVIQSMDCGAKSNIVVRALKGQTAGDIITMALGDVCQISESSDLSAERDSMRRRINVLLLKHKVRFNVVAEPINEVALALFVSGIPDRDQCELYRLIYEYRGIKKDG